MIKEVIVGLGLGSIFGATLEKSEGPDAFQRPKDVESFTNSESFLPRITPTMVLSNSLGGITLGIGMFMGGGCPGTFLSAFGSGSKSAPYGLLGGITGALFYSLLSKFIGKHFNSVLNFGPISLNGEKDDFWKYSLPFSAALFGVIFLVKQFLDPKTKKENEVNKGLLFMKNDSWSPVISGFILGSVQLPMLLFTKTMIGASTQYVTLIGLLLTKLFPSFRENNEYVSSTLDKKTSYFGLIMHLGIILGGFISSKLSGNFERNINAEPLTTEEKLKVFISGFLLLFGARMTGGCNSGHGLSGMASQSISSYLATASIFAGGIGFALISSLLWSKRKNE